MTTRELLIEMESGADHNLNFATQLKIYFNIQVVVSRSRSISDDRRLRAIEKIKLLRLFLIQREQLN